MLRKKRVVRPILLFLTILVGASSWLLYRAYQQERLNFAFIAAIKNKDTGRAWALLRQGADINTHQPLGVPTAPGEYLRVLLDRVRGRSVPGKTRWSALMLAVSENNTDLTLALLSRGALTVNDRAEWAPSYTETDTDPLLAITSGHDNIVLVQALLDHGAHVNAGGSSGTTALLAASYALEALDREEKVPQAKHREASQHYMRLLHLLLKYGADPGARKNNGLSVLGSAALYDQAEGVALLLSHGADSRDTDPNHPTPLTALYNAVRHDNIGMVKMLLARGARVDSKGDYSLVLTYDEALTRLLLDHGADPNAHGNLDVAQGDDETPLIRAARLEELPTVRLLLSRGAHVNEPSNLKGKSALMWATWNKDMDIAPYLIEHGATVNAHDKAGKTALMYAADGGNAEIVRYLLNHGAEINARDKGGATALDIAADSLDENIVPLLKSRGGKK